MDRERAKDLLPHWVMDRLDADEALAVEAWVDGDPELRAEAALLRSLAAARPETPAGLADRIAAAVQGTQAPPARPRGRAVWLPSRVPAWGWAAAAAVAFLALVPNLLVDGPRDPDVDPLVVALGQAPTPWGEDDDLVAGAPVLSGLSDEALESLLLELGG